MSEQPDLGGLQPQVVKKPKVVKCPRCGETTFNLIKDITFADKLSFDEETGKPFIELFNFSEAMQYYIPHKECDRIECSECGELIPKELLLDLPDRIEMDY